MPTPSSRTREHGVAVLAARTSTVIVPPSPVYLIALPTRLATICSTRVGSPSTQTGARSRTMRCRPELDRARARRVHQRRRGRPARGSSTILPGDHAPGVEQVVGEPREVRRLAGDDLRAPAPPRAGGTPAWSSSATAFVMAPSGLRSSWPSMARNSSFARFAASAAARACCSRRSSSSRSRSARGALRGRAGQRLRRPADLPDLGHGRRERLAPPERLGRALERRHRLRDAARDERGGADADHDRQQNPAARASGPSATAAPSDEPDGNPGRDRSSPRSFTRLYAV